MTQDWLKRFDELFDKGYFTWENKSWSKAAIRSFIEQVAAESRKEGRNEAVDFIRYECWDDSASGDWSRLGLQASSLEAARRGGN